MRPREQAVHEAGQHIAAALLLLLESTATPAPSSSPAATPGPLYLTTEEVAARFRTSPSSVREWRHTETGPRGTRYGKRVLYRLEDVEAWEARCQLTDG